MIRTRSKLAAATGFTLVEMLVATAVLAILVLLVSQLVNNASITTLNSRKHLDADSQARMVFDRMEYDFARMPKRTDLDYIFSKQDGNANDKIFFYSEAPGYGINASNAESTTSLVGYRVNDKLELERLGKALTWDGNPTGNTTGGVVFLTYPPGSTTPDPATLLDTIWQTTIGSAPSYQGNDADYYHVLADGVFRFEFCFQQRDGTYVIPSAAHPSTTFSIPKNASAVVVALAILDPSSRNMVHDSSGMVSALADPTPGDLQKNRLMAEIWHEQIYNPNFASVARIPKPAAANIRIYQRTFYLHTR